MNLTLSSTDQERLQAALRVLLSPLDYPHVDAWRSAVNRIVKELLAADTATFLLPDCEASLAYCEEREMPKVSEYPDRVAALHKQFAIWERHVRLGACDRQTLWSPYLDEYFSSEYYNEYIVPLRAFDYVGLAIPLSEELTNHNIASLFFHHDRNEGVKFGERGVGLLQLLLPAFKAGVQSFGQFHAHRAAFTRTLDALKEGLLLCNLAGRVLHQNPALTELLAADPERKRLLEEMAKAARALVSLPRRKDEVPICTPAARSVQTVHARYRITGSYVGGAHIGPESYVLVTLERTTAELPSELDLRQRFSLTRQEARIALLLARRKTNDEIAEALCISAHTARHHTENVLAKLGVHSRNEVATTITAPPLGT